MSAKRFALLTFAAVLPILAAMPASAATQTQAQKFANQAAMGNQFEIDTSNIALQKSQTPAVRQFAQHMIDDHTKVGQDMEAAVAGRNGAPPILTPDAAYDKKHQKMIDALNADSPEAFDKDYVKDQLAAHKEALSLFRSYASGGGNPQLQGFARQELPTLQSHLKEAGALKSSLPAS